MINSFVWEGRSGELEMTFTPEKATIRCPACKNTSSVRGFRHGDVVDFKVVHEDDCPWLAARRALEMR